MRQLEAAGAKVEYLIVTPVAKTGLHCGGAIAAAVALGGWVTPVAKTGLHCGMNQVAGYSGGLSVTPVAKTGLHCGGLHRRRHERFRLLVTPVAKTGLHCGGAIGGEQPGRAIV